MNLDQVKKDILNWCQEFVEVPHPALGGWPPCPYARSARLNKTVNILVGTDPYTDLKQQCEQGLGQWQVIVIAYNPESITHEEFARALEAANQDFLLAADMLVLEDHPGDPEIVNGISMNQGKYALALLQGLSDLNDKAAIMAKKGFYHSWPEEYLTVLFQHRKDPRQ